MHRGKIILIPFPFTNLSNQKVGPAVILYQNNKTDDLIVSFISSNQNKKMGTFDIGVKANIQNGLKTDSIIKVAKIATLEKKIALGEIGELDKQTLSEINRKLKTLFSI